MVWNNCILTDRTAGWATADPDLPSPLPSPIRWERENVLPSCSVSPPFISRCRQILYFATALALFEGAVVSVEAAKGPVGVSQNGRYFVDATGEPFYFLADTQ